MTAISVIIPTYNREKLIERAIGSVLRQTVACAEILVIDDGSTDQTAAIVHALAANSPVPVRQFFQEKQGPAAARNAGIQQARSGLIAFLDSDDHWRKDKLARQLKAMEEHPGYLISHTREQWLRQGSHLNQKKKHLPRHGDIFDHCLQLCTVGMSTVMARKELFTAVGLFAAELPCCEDYDFWLRVSAGYPFLLVDRPLTIKEGGREDQVSFQYRVGMDQLRIQALIRLLDNVPLSGEQRELARQELRRKCLVFGHGCIKHGRNDMGATYLHLYKKYEMEAGLPRP